MPEPIEVEGKTVEEAIETGLKQAGLRREDAEIKILNEGSSGLFGLMGSKAAKISIHQKTAEQKKESPGIKPFVVPVKLVEEMKKSIYNHVNEIIKLMKVTTKPPVIKVTQNEMGFTTEINFQDPTDGSLLIGRGGRSLFSLEIILQSIINHEFRGKIESPPFPRIMADVNQYRMRQEEKIKNTIARTMELVRKTGKPQQLEPMPARMRRMVHIYLKENPEFETHSEGIGDMRRVVIKLRSSVESRGK